MSSGVKKKSAAFCFCVWPFYTFPCDTGSFLSKLYDESAKVWKNSRKTLTKVRYLNLRKKNQISAAFRFCVWPFYIFPCNNSSIRSKLYDESAKVRKKDRKTPTKVRYLTLGVKNQNSAAFHFCVWPFYIFPCDTSLIWSKLYDEFAKVRKNGLKTLTKVRYLTLKVKNKNSAAFRFCVWPFYTFPCDTSSILSKL